MVKNDIHNYTPLPDPLLITEQKWPEGTLPLVSTSTLTYNHEPYIRDCIEGILMQKTTFPIRVCIFEDASTDKTAEIVKEYAEKYPELIFAFCQKENTWKKGEIRRQARKPFNEVRNVAKYIALCEGDDYWADPLKLQKQVEFMEENPDYSLCYHSHKRINSGMLSKNTFPKKGRDFTQDELIATPSGIATATKFYINYTSVYGIPAPVGFGADFYLNAFLGTLGKCKFLASVGPSVRRIHPGGVWSSKGESSKYYGVINTKIKVYNYFKEQKDEHRMNISLEELKHAIDLNLPKAYPEYKRHNYPYRHFKLMYKDMGIVIFFEPVIELLKRILKKVKGR